MATIFIDDQRQYTIIPIQTDKSSDEYQHILKWENEIQSPKTVYGNDIIYKKISKMYLKISH
jgi:hypothetical protein